MSREIELVLASPLIVGCAKGTSITDASEEMDEVSARTTGALQQIGLTCTASEKGSTEIEVMVEHAPLFQENAWHRISIDDKGYGVRAVDLR